jgi:probable F420-dependent oxidoreductase
MRFIFQYPDLHGTDGDMLDAGPVAELAIAAERAGWDGFSFTEHPAPNVRWLEAGGHQSLDPFVALSHVAAVTSRLTLLTYLSVVAYRNPSLLAKTAATLDRLSDGRFVLGVGTGYLKAEFFALGVDFDERNALFDEALDLLPMYWSGEPFDYDGAHFSCRGTIGRPRPVRQPIPVWIGGNATRTLQRVATQAQGWMPLTGAVASSTVRTPALASLDDLRRRLRTLEELAGDRFASLDITVAYTDPSIHDLDADVERHRDALGALHELGATRIVVSGPGGRHPRALEFVQGFGERYVT